jgi:hypothetical protein
MPEPASSDAFVVEATSESLGSPTGLSNEALLNALRMILEGTSLVDVLTSIARLIEAHSNGKRHK